MLFARARAYYTLTGDTYTRARALRSVLPRSPNGSQLAYLYSRRLIAYNLYIYTGIDRFSSRARSDLTGESPISFPAEPEITLVFQKPLPFFISLSLSRVRETGFSTSCLRGLFYIRTQRTAWHYNSGDPREWTLSRRSSSVCHVRRRLNTCTHVYIIRRASHGGYPRRRRRKYKFIAAARPRCTKKLSRGELHKKVHAHADVTRAN